MMVAMARTLAGAKSTLVWLGMVVAVLVLCRVLDSPAGRWVAVPLAGLCVNLVAAVAVNGKLRRDLGLLVFHLGLALLAGTAALGRLFAFDGHVEVTEGAALDPAQVVGQGGPLHPRRFAEAAFVQGAFKINYLPGMKRRETRSRVSVSDGAGGWVQHVVGDDTPLILAGYRYYTTHNKGYAPVLAWTVKGRTETGAVHLPSYPANDFRQGTEWQLPDGSGEVALWLSMPTPAYSETASWEFRKPDDARLVVIDGEKRHELAPGDEVGVRGGSLRYVGLNTWMGYTIFYDPTLPWLVAEALLAVVGLGIHAAVRVGTAAGVGVGEELRHGA